MTQLSSTKVVEPFGEVNVLPQLDGSMRVRATILMKPQVEDARTGLAIDGSVSMKPNFGVSGAVSPLFAAAAPNLIEPVARTLAAYLAGFGSDGTTAVIYWACGPGGMRVEELGVVDDAGAKKLRVTGPKEYGTGTKLLPAVRWFAESKYPDAPWGIFVFITDGILEDMPDVKQYSLALARQIASGKRNALKLVLIGIGHEVDVGQMEELDDLDYGGLKMPDGQEVDLWDHKLAAEMQKLEEIFAEVVSKNTILVPTAEVLDDSGNSVQPLDRASYHDGLPALLEFVVPRGTKEFTLVLPNDVKVTQTLVA